MTHTCHVPGCDIPASLNMLMCKTHWRQVPGLLRGAVWAAYRPGQEKDKTPSREWVRAARAAINSVSVVNS